MRNIQLLKIVSTGKTVDGVGSAVALKILKERTGCKNPSRKMLEEARTAGVWLDLADTDDAPEWYITDEPCRG